jgi:hypothetical protein
LTAADKHDWPAIFKRAKELLRSGQAEPTFMSLGRALGINHATMHSAFKRRYGIASQVELRTLAGSFHTGKDKYGGIDPQKVLTVLRERPHSLGDLADRLDRGRTAVEAALAQMLQDNYGILRQDDQVSLPAYTPPDPLPTLYDDRAQRISFAVMSDLHFGSRHIQASALLRFIRLAHDEYGITRFFVPGDLTAGYGVYRGQQNDLYAFSADDQADSLVNTLPQWSDTQYLVIGGNHDYSFMKANGHNLPLALSRLRSDIVYCGFDQAEIPLVERDGRIVTSAVLWHPSGGVPYALSYRGQKFAAELTRQELAEVVLDEKPAPSVRFVFWGHLHVSDWFPYGPIEVIGPGCFEGTNGYLKQKGLMPVVSGLIVEADLTSRGLVAACHVHPIRFVEREDDYHAAYNPVLARKVQEQVEPVFTIGKE